MVSVTAATRTRMIIHSNHGSGTSSDTWHGIASPSYEPGSFNGFCAGIKRLSEPTFEDKCSSLFNLKSNQIIQNFNSISNLVSIAANMVPPSFPALETLLSLDLVERPEYPNQIIYGPIELDGAIREHLPVSIQASSTMLRALSFWP